MVIEYGYCHCGCGEKTNIAKVSDKSKGHVRGEPKKYILYHRVKGMELHNHWKDGTTIRNGYVSKNISGKYRSEHIVVMEQKIGRPLLKGEVVHHINGIRSDNNPNNLMLFGSSSEHTKYHREERAEKQCGNRHYRKCHFCREYDDLSNMTQMNKYIYYHKNCGTRNK